MTPTPDTLERIADEIEAHGYHRLAERLRALAGPVAQPGGIYDVPHHGRCEFVRWDTYMGERTMEIRRLSDGVTTHIHPHQFFPSALPGPVAQDAQGMAEPLRRSLTDALFNAMPLYENQTQVGFNVKIATDDAKKLLAYCATPIPSDTARTEGVYGYEELRKEFTAWHVTQWPNEPVTFDHAWSAFHHGRTRHRPPPPATLAEVEAAVDAYTLATMDFARAEFRDDFGHHREKKAQARAALLALYAKAIGGGGK